MLLIKYYFFQCFDTFWLVIIHNYWFFVYWNCIVHVHPIVASHNKNIDKFFASHINATSFYVLNQCDIWKPIKKKCDLNVCNPISAVKSDYGFVLLLGTCNFPQLFFPMGKNFPLQPFRICSLIQFPL